MKVEYDREADALYIQLREVHPQDNLGIEDGVTVDVDADGHIVGVETLNITKRPRTVIDTRSVLPYEDFRG